MKIKYWFYYYLGTPFLWIEYYCDKIYEWTLRKRIGK